MNTTLFNRLHAEGLISASSHQKIQERSSVRLFSLHWELKTILYLGVLLLSGGLGILVYKNIDTIGHQVILLFIALICAGSFMYCFKRKLPFSRKKVEPPNAFFDYILLLGCLMLITFIAYIQFQYTVFGTRYGLATFIPMVLLFFTAYYFDHLGVLSLAITNLAAWMGITVTPTHILESNDFNSSTIIFTAILLGVLLIAAGMASVKTHIKKHFEFTYTNFGMHILFIAVIAAMFQFEQFYLLSFIVLLGVAYFFYRKSVNKRSFYFLLIATIYTYIGTSWVVIKLLDNMGGFSMGVIYLALIYFIVSGIALVMFLMRTNKKLKA
jgi:hypothetical protein